MITATTLRSALLKELAKDYGLLDVQFSNGTLYEDLDAEVAAKTYFFMADEQMLIALKDFEAQHEELAGLAALFEIKIIVTIMGY